jgi:hypothetical protein
LQEPKVFLDKAVAVTVLILREPVLNMVAEVGAEGARIMLVQQVAVHSTAAVVAEAAAELMQVTKRAVLAELQVLMSQVVVGRLEQRMVVLVRQGLAVLSVLAAAAAVVITAVLPDLAELAEFQEAVAEAEAAVQQLPVTVLPGVAVK